MVMNEMNRRHFFTTATAGAAVLASRNVRAAASASDTVVLAIMGTNGRGSDLASAFAKQSGVEIAYISDCDERAIQKGIDATAAQGSRKPQGIKDFRRALDDSAVDAIVCAAPNHWHAAATILACLAGKHVYVEKPACQTSDEGERMIAAARNANRVVQVGLQRRSSPLYRTVVDRVRGGAIGRVLYAKSWYFANRPSIGRGKETEPPAWLDYNLWQGPAIERPYRDNLIHYNWHFFWHWGNGELGNNGVHTVDICRWVLDVDFPSKVTASGAKLRYDDDQETPDTCMITYDCDGRTMVWEGISWSPAYQTNSSVGMEFRGENGTLFVDDGGYAIYDPQGKVLEKITSSLGDAEHLLDFLKAVRENAAPNCDIVDGHKSTLFCHLGNIAVRTRQALEIDPSNGHVLNNTAAEALWTREYRKGWIPNT
jgi:predicted dehydrogenase